MEGDWGDYVFCRNQAKIGGPWNLLPALGGGYATCGLPFPKFGCTGIASSKTDWWQICVAYLDGDKKKIGATKISNTNFFRPLSHPTKGIIKLNSTTSANFDCGMIVEESVNKFVLGRKCNDENQDCVIFLEEKWSVVNTGNIIGKYNQAKCY